MRVHYAKRMMEVSTLTVFETHANSGRDGLDLDVPHGLRLGGGFPPGPRRPGRGPPRGRPQRIHGLHFGRGLAQLVHRGRRLYDTGDRDLGQAR